MENDGPPRDLLDSDDELNSAALKGVWGWTTTWAADLARLLRSGEPIHWMVREALADAVEAKGMFGARMELRGYEEVRAEFLTQAKFQRYLTIGKWIQHQLNEGIRYQKALDEAFGVFRVSEGSCKAALTFSRKAREWIDRASVPGGRFEFFTAEQLEEQYITGAARGRIPDPDESAADHNEVVQSLLASIRESLVESDDPQTER